jgi:phytanoyl-CoA hydroxylase
VSEAPLSADELRHYRDHGYAVKRRFFSESELEPFVKRFLAIVNEEVPPAPGMTLMRDVMVAKGAVKATTRAAAIAKIQDFHNDPVLYEGYVKHPRLLDAAQQFTGPDIKSVHNMLINKPPGVDGRHPLHQDLLYFPFRPADKIVGTWTALEACTRENGCLVVVPGTHRGELLPHENPDWTWLNLAYFGAKGVGEKTDRVHLVMEPGDTVFFHPVLIHGSGQNRTAGFRRAISAHYASAACCFLPGAAPLRHRRPYLLVRGSEHPTGI